MLTQEQKASRRGIEKRWRQSRQRRANDPPVPGSTTWEKLKSHFERPSNQIITRRVVLFALLAMWSSYQSSSAGPAFQVCTRSLPALIQSTPPGQDDWVGRRYCSALVCAFGYWRTRGRTSKLRRGGGGRAKRFGNPRSVLSPDLFWDPSFQSFSPYSSPVASRRNSSQLSSCSPPCSSAPLSSSETLCHFPEVNNTHSQTHCTFSKMASSGREGGDSPANGREDEGNEGEDGKEKQEQRAHGSRSAKGSILLSFSALQWPVRAACASGTASLINLWANRFSAPVLAPVVAIVVSWCDCVPA